MSPSRSGLYLASKVMRQIYGSGHKNMDPQLSILNPLTFFTIHFDIFLRKECDNVKSNDNNNLEMVRYTVYQRFVRVKNNLLYLFEKVFDEFE